MKQAYETALLQYASHLEYQVDIFFFFLHFNKFLVYFVISFLLLFHFTIIYILDILKIKFRQFITVFKNLTVCICTNTIFVKG